MDFKNKIKTWLWWILRDNKTNKATTLLLLLLLYAWTNRSSQISKLAKLAISSSSRNRTRPPHHILLWTNSRIQRKHSSSHPQGTTKGKRHTNLANHTWLLSPPFLFVFLHNCSSLLAPSLLITPLLLFYVSPLIN